MGRLNLPIPATDVGSTLLIRLKAEKIFDYLKLPREWEPVDEETLLFEEVCLLVKHEFFPESISGADEAQTQKLTTSKPALCERIRSRAGAMNRFGDSPADAEIQRLGFQECVVAGLGHHYAVDLISRNQKTLTATESLLAAFCEIFGFRRDKFPPRFVESALRAVKGDYREHQEHQRHRTIWLGANAKVRLDVALSMAKAGLLSIGRGDQISRHTNSQPDPWASPLGAETISSVSDFVRSLRANG